VLSASVGLELVSEVFWDMLSTNYLEHTTVLSPNHWKVETRGKESDNISDPDFRLADFINAIINDEETPPSHHAFVKIFEHDSDRFGLILVQFGLVRLEIEKVIWTIDHGDKLNIFVRLILLLSEGKNFLQRVRF
jgi:hypothetical protein